MAQAAISDLIEAIRNLGRLEKEEIEDKQKQVQREMSKRFQRDHMTQEEPKETKDRDKQKRLLLLFASGRILLSYLQSMASVTKTLVVRWPTFLWSFFLIFDSIDLHTSLVTYWMPCIMSDMFEQDELALLSRIVTLGSGFVLTCWFMICALHWESRCFWADYKERKQDFEFFAEPEWIEARFASRVVFRRAFVCVLSFSSLLYLCC